MFSGIPQQIVSFLSSFKAFFFFVVAFIVFGSAFLFLAQPLCADGWLCNRYLKPLFDSDAFNFGGVMGTFKLLIFSYITGLILYEFSRLIIKVVRYIASKINESNNKKAERPNDIDIYTYLGSRDLARDIYMLQIFYSSVTRLLLGTVGLAIVLLSSQPSFLFPLSVVISFTFLIWINMSADREVHTLGKQVKEIIQNGEYEQQYKTRLNVDHP